MRYNKTVGKRICSTVDERCKTFWIHLAETFSSIGTCLNGRTASSVLSSPMFHPLYIYEDVHKRPNYLAEECL